MGVMVSNTDNLTRANIWTQEMKDTLHAQTMARKYVRWIDLPEGSSTLNIPSIGTFEVSDYAEGQPVKYSDIATGNFTFTPSKYKQTGTYISRKAQQDLFYASQLVASFVPGQMRALDEQMESDILKVIPDGQTASNLNAINGANHRWVGSGTNETMDIKDFALARYSLDQANVPRTNRIAIVDPSVEYALSTLPNITNMSYNPMWEGIVTTGLTTGMSFIRNIYGFDVYVSMFLESGISETINSVTASAGVANLFFSATPGTTMPIIGAIVQQPRVDTDFNKDYQRDEYVVTSRYGLGFFREENAVVVITDTDQVS